MIGSLSLESHEYLRDTLSLIYKECKSCTTRSELTCIKCGLCWSCHWMVEQADKIEISTQGLAYEGGNDKKREHILDKQSQYLKTNVIDVFGKETEPICDYLRCRHKFSEHGIRISKCQCKHPRNSAAGAYFLLNNI